MSVTIYEFRNGGLVVSPFKLTEKDILQDGNLNNITGLGTKKLLCCALGWMDAFDTHSEAHSVPGRLRNMLPVPEHMLLSIWNDARGEPSKVRKERRVAIAHAINQLTGATE